MRARSAYRLETPMWIRFGYDTIPSLSEDDRPLMLITYLLVDFENVKPTAADVTQLRGEHFRLWIFRGPHQTKFDADMVEAWQPLGNHVRFVQSKKSGKNSLDFHIAFCLGMAHRKSVAANRIARYVVVSKDDRFDSLFEYARSERCHVTKAATIREAVVVAEAMDFVPSPTEVASSLRSKCASHSA
jgi:hypothetical protein